MYAKVYGATYVGLDGQIIHVETDISNGLPSFDIVGLPTASVREAKERVRAAIKNSGCEFPNKRITVNLAPADIKKDSSGLDLAIAIGILRAAGVIRNDEVNKSCFIGELSLNGEISPVTGVLPMAISAEQIGLQSIYVAKENGKEASLSNIRDIFVVNDLRQLVHILTGKVEGISYKSSTIYKKRITYDEDLSEVQGQFVAKRGLEIAAAGGHNLLLNGPPGSGKTMLARRLITILPPLLEEEALELTKIYSVAGLLSREELLYKRPFRSPHHTVTMAGMIGGGIHLKPGDITLAHRGVLFLDELPEFKRSVLEVLRQPLEEQCIYLSRANGRLSYPADFLLVASMNPCPCGNAGSKEPCICSPHEIKKYTQKISGPLLDRIDLYTRVEQPTYEELHQVKENESSESIRMRVIKARQLQKSRLQRYGITCNARMSHKVTKGTCVLSKDAQQFLRDIFKTMHISARGHDRLLKVSRTIADLEGAAIIELHHLAEAASFRQTINDFQ